MAAIRVSAQRGRGPQRVARRAQRAGSEAGLRERNKRDKLERIKRAARFLFTKNGFDATTTREIAQRARVGAGTLFLYAKDKRELLLRMFEEDLKPVREAAAATMPHGQGLMAEVMHSFDCFFEHYAAAPDLARVFLKELLFVSQDDVGALTLEAVRELTAPIERAQQRGEMRADVSPLLAASNFFGVYYFTLHAWLGGYFTTEAARSFLRNLLALQMQGLRRGGSGREGK